MKKKRIKNSHEWLNSDPNHNERNKCFKGSLYTGDQKYWDEWAGRNRLSDVVIAGKPPEYK